MSEHKRPRQYAYLEQLSLEELKGIIRADAELEQNEDTDFIYAVLEVIDKKERELPAISPWMWINRGKSSSGTVRPGRSGTPYSPAPRCA